MRFVFGVAANAVGGGTFVGAARVAVAAFQVGGVTGQGKEIMLYGAVGEGHV